MKKRILIFGGTTEGRLLAQKLREWGYPVTVSVATDYGARLLQGLGADVRVGRLGQRELEELFRRESFWQVVDATHPYAVEISQNLRAAASRCGLPLRRLLRPEGKEQGRWRTVKDATGAVEVLRETEGQVLLTTGSKDLAAFTALEDYRSRLWVRILPSPASLDQALELGYLASHIIAMQGPFSSQLNEALLREYEIKLLVTKFSGRPGGFWEKVEAAEAVGTQLIVIQRPTQETGETLEELLLEWKGETL